MNIQMILQQAVDNNASDVFIVAGLPISIRKSGVIRKIDETKLLPQDTEHMIHDLYRLADNRDIRKLTEGGDDDFSLSIPGMSRFRICTYRQRNSLAAVIRVISFALPDPQKLSIPEAIIRLGNDRNGMVLVTGPAGSGKSTTLACIIHQINVSREAHIITLEDPLEFLHRHHRSIISQREINLDTQNYVTALRAALRQSPDVVLLGEMRDYETINVAMTAAETGHLLLSTLHTLGAASTIDRIIDVFPANQQRQIAIQLSSVLNAVVSQQLVPAVDGSMVPAFEIMTVTPAIRNMIRENKVHQIDGLLYASAKENMVSMDNSLLQLYKQGVIDREAALGHATNPEMLARKL